MGRVQRIDLKDYYYHVLNRGNARETLFNSSEDYMLFERILEKAVKMYDIRLVAYCVMPTHFHIVLYPRQDGDIQKFMQWLTLTHTQRVHSKEDTVGHGHIYQGRYKLFLVNSDNYLYTLLQYVEQNPLRANLVKNLKNWKWGSYYRRNYGTVKQQELLSTHEYQEQHSFNVDVQSILKDDNLVIIRNSVRRGKPYGGELWVENIVKKFGIEITIRKTGRPKSKKGT